MTTVRPGSVVANFNGVVLGVALPASGAEVPFIRTVADAEELLGRGAAMIHARGGIAEHLAAEDGGPFVGSNPTERAIAAALNSLRLGDRAGPSPALWRPCPECKGRSFVVRHRPDQGSASLRACPVCRGSGEVACPAEREPAGADVASPPVDLAAENAALRSALDTSGELLAEAHEELERLRGAT